MRVVMLFTIILLLVMPSISHAQDTMDLSIAFEVTVPENWMYTGRMTTGAYWETANSLIRIRTHGPHYREWFDTPTELDLFLEYMVTNVYDIRTFDAESIEAISFGDYEGIAYSTEMNEAGNRFERRVMLYMLENDFIVLGYIQPLSGYEVDAEDAAALQTVMATVTARNTARFFEGTELDIPDGWQLWHDQNTVFSLLLLRNGNLIVDIGMRPRYAAIAGFEKPADLLAYMVSGNDTYEIGNWDPNRIEDIRLAGFDGAFFPYETDHLNSLGYFNRAIIMLPLSTNDTVLEVIVSSVALDDSLEPVFDLLDGVRPGHILTCMLYADPGTRIRAEATTTSDIVRTTDEENLIAWGRFTDSAGYDWFDIGEGWIRSDVIYHEYNACQGIPTRH